jgi:hypothetical protein
MATNGATAITVSTSQNVGIGTTSPTSPLQVNTAGVNTTVQINSTDANGGYGAVLSLNNTGTGGRQYAIYSTSNADGDVGGGKFKITDATAGTTRMLIDSDGNLGLGGSPEGSTQKLFVKGNKSAEGSSANDGFIKFIGASGVSAAQFMRIDAGNYSGTACGFSIGRNSSTSRSINTGGTVNASGADYAEYMTKCGDFTVSKGDVVGINAQGKLTNVFADAIAFVVKSTDPSYVGGDTWGIELEGNELEIARQAVDRIAFSGQVPVNVTGATAGQYIIPVNDNGAIKGQAVSNPTFEQYQIVVGKVIAIESDGRAKIIVKVA